VPALADRDVLEGLQHDWEFELGVVIGRPAYRIAPKEAMDVVAGYVIGSDICTRDVMNRSDLPMTNFIMSKGRPTFFPVGPYLVPRECVPDPRQLRLTLSVNGEVMQDDTVDDIICGVDELVSYASHAAVLGPGDLLLTGSPVETPLITATGGWCPATSPTPGSPGSAGSGTGASRRIPTLSHAGTDRVSRRP
jgi:2-keto-4-pentenoate hydratase/2-oxohepta-3-ene-1,7-dioic acid hydratase in catechol pathway